MRPQGPEEGGLERGQEAEYFPQRLARVLLTEPARHPSLTFVLPVRSVLRPQDGTNLGFNHLVGKIKSKRRICHLDSAAPLLVTHSGVESVDPACRACPRSLPKPSLYRPPASPTSGACCEAWGGRWTAVRGEGHYSVLLSFPYLAISQKPNKATSMCLNVKGTWNPGQAT